MTNNSQATHNLDAAYQRATLFQKALTDMNKVARNTTLVPHWIGESDCCWYRRHTASGVEFRLVNAKNASNQEAFDHQTLAVALSDLTQQEISADNLPMTQVNITLSPTQVYFVAFDQHYRFDSETEQCQAVEPELDRHSLERLVSPDGKKIAFVRDYNLWIQDIDTGEVRALTGDGEAYFGYAGRPILWGQPMGTELQARWSPDSLTLFTLQTDNRQVKRTPVIDYVPQDGSVRPTVTNYPCGYPGDEHVEEQRLLAINVETGVQQAANYRRVPVSRSGYGLFNDNLGWWSTDSRHAYFVDMERDYKVARVVEFDTCTGATRILFEETSETYLNLSPSEATPATSVPLPDSNELIWFSERSDWGHLYLYDLKTGDLKHPITQGEWMVREVLHFDAERRELYFQAGGRASDRNPYYLDICRVNIDSGEITELLSTDDEYTVLGSLGWRTFISLVCPYNSDCLINTCGVSPTSSYIVATRSRADQAPVNLLFDRDGNLLLELEKADVSGLPEGWQWPEPVKLLAADGKTDIYGAIFRPSDFSPDKQYPVIDCSVCIAEFSTVPIGSFTNAIYGGRCYLGAISLAELGFIVIAIDGRGTAYRNRAFVDESYGWVPSSNSAEDRIAGITQLAERYAYMDIDRVGVIGFDGSVGAVYSMLEHPEFYKVGVSHALQDSRMMTATWGEQYEEPEPENHYSYAEKLAGNLRGKLLLTHGLLDRMDHCAATWRLIDALQQANKDFDMLILPNEGGLESGAHIGSPYIIRRTWDYFVKHLQNVVPPEEFSIEEGKALSSPLSKDA